MCFSTVVCLQGLPFDVHVQWRLVEEKLWQRNVFFGVQLTWTFPDAAHPLVVAAGQVPGSAGVKTRHRHLVT